MQIETHQNEISLSNQELSKLPGGFPAQNGKELRGPPQVLRDLPFPGDPASKRTLRIDELTFFVYLFTFIPLSTPMVLLHWTLLFHIIGVGLLFASLLGGMVLHFRSAGSKDWPARTALLPVMKTLGLFSPAAVAVLLLSGVGNIIALSLTNPMPFWLHVKLSIFLVLVVLGVWGAILARKRAGLIVSLASGISAPGTESRLKSAEAVLSSVYIVQGLLTLAVVAISVIKP
jgi:hypothetical protein